MLTARLNGFGAERVEVGHVPGVKFGVTSARPEAAREFRVLLATACACSHTFRAGVVGVESMGELLPAALVLCGATRPGVAAVGELGLDGRVRPVRGAFLLGEALTGSGVICARDNAAEFAASGCTPYPVDSLSEALAIMRGEFVREWLGGDASAARLRPDVDPCHIRGQGAALEAMATAIGRGRPVVLHGPPGCGKTLMARALHGLLGPMSEAERIEASRIHSVAGLLSGGSGFIPCRPFRAPHHTASLSAIVGGGAGRDVRPGEFSLSHGGVLFLDELPEFARHVLQALPHVFTGGRVLLARAGSVVELPARPAALVASANPCLCGYHGYPETGRECRCLARSVESYRARWQGVAAALGAVVVEVPPVRAEALQRVDSAVSAEQVERLRALVAGGAS